MLATKEYAVEIRSVDLMPCVEGCVFWIVWNKSMLQTRYARIIHDHVNPTALCHYVPHGHFPVGFLSYIKVHIVSSSAKRLRNQFAQFVINIRQIHDGPIPYEGSGNSLTDALCGTSDKSDFPLKPFHAE